MKSENFFDGMSKIARLSTPATAALTAVGATAPLGYMIGRGFHTQIHDGSIDKAIDKYKDNPKLSKRFQLQKDNPNMATAVGAAAVPVASGAIAYSLARLIGGKH